MAQALATTAPTGAAVTRRLTGIERAAAVMLALGETYGAPVWAQLDEVEVRDLSSAMSTLGPVDTETVETLLIDFVSRMSSTGALIGNIDSTERLLAQLLPKDRVGQIMEEIRGPAGRTMWEKLSNVQDQVLANYLKNEYPQTVAVVLSRIRPEQAGRVLAILPEDYAVDVVRRMLGMGSVQKDIIERIEKTLRSEFMSGLSSSSRRDSHEQMAEIFNSFDRQTEARFLSKLEEASKDSADRIKALMFTFEDLAKLDSAGIQTLLRDAPRDRLAIALKGASQTMRAFIMGNMSSRASKMLADDIEAMGPVRLRDVDDAQTLLVNLTKDLAANGKLTIAKSKGEDELVY